MRETQTVSLYFTEKEVLEALKMWCCRHKPNSANHFERKSMMEFVDRKENNDGELAVMFDGEIELENFTSPTF